MRVKIKKKIEFRCKAKSCCFLCYTQFCSNFCVYVVYIQSFPEDIHDKVLMFNQSLQYCLHLVYQKNGVTSYKTRKATSFHII